MVSKTFEWLRAADLNPDDNMVASRANSARDLEDRIRKSKDYGLLVGSVCAAIGGCERLGEKSPIVATLLECVRTHQPAFPGSLSENALHLRVVCCLGLGELLDLDDQNDPDNDDLMAASLLLAGLGAKPKEAGRHLERVFDELAAVARANLQLQAVAERDREELNWKGFKELESSLSEPSTFIQRLLPVLQGAFEALQKRGECDREELEVMWWLYNQYSDRLEKPVKQATPFLAAAAIGREVADRVTPPATAGLSDLVAQAAVRDRSAAQTKAKSLDKIVSDLGEIGRKLLLPDTDSARRLVRGNPPILPLSWLCARLEESQGAPGWEGEMKAVTGLTAESEWTPGSLATQVFVERQAQRVYQSLVKG